jgi:hypothetical protein
MAVATLTASSAAAVLEAQATPRQKAGCPPRSAGPLVANPGTGMSRNPSPSASPTDRSGAVQIGGLPPGENTRILYRHTGGVKKFAEVPVTVGSDIAN